MKITDIIKESGYSLVQFSDEQIAQLEKRIITKTDKNGKEVFYVKCLVRDKEIKLTPEECVRQLYLDTLVNVYDYPVSRMELEYAVKFGREVKRADIVIFDKDRTTKGTTQKLLQRNRRANRCVDKRKLDFLLQPQRPELL